MPTLVACLWRRVEAIQPCRVPTHFGPATRLGRPKSPWNQGALATSQVEMCPRTANSGLTEALVVGAKRVVAELGRPGGFLDNPQFRIPLPGPLEQARSTLKLVGLSGLADDLEVRLNRAAEEATPVAGDLLIQAVHNLTIKDAAGILNGAKDSATRYLERQTSQPLAEKMRPIVDRTLADAGAVKAFDSLAGR